MTQKLHENEQPSWIFTKARTRSTRASACTQPIAPTSPATNAGSPRGASRRRRRCRGARERGTAQVRRAAGQVDARVRARRARRCLAALRDRLVRDAARADHRDVAVGVLRVAVAQQRLAHLVRVDVRDLAAEKVDRERRHGAGSYALRRAGDVARPAVERPPTDMLEARQHRSLGGEIPGGDERRAVDARRRAPRRIRARCSRPRRPRGASGRPDATSRTSSDDAVHDGVRTGRLDRRRLDVDRDDRAEAEQRGRDREDAGAAADVEQRPRLRAPAARRGRAASSACDPVPNARPGSITTASASSSGCSHGGPTHRRPTRTGRWNARHLSSHPLSTSAARPPPKNAHMRSSPAASVYAASSTPLRRSTSSKPSGKISIMVARASSARRVADLDRDAAERAQRNALFSFSKKLSSCR